MRVTNNMMVDQLRRNLLLNQRSMYTKQDQLSTGKRIQRASDDPILSSKILKFSTDLSELEQYDRNSNDALSWLEVTESAVYDNVRLLQRSRELAVAAANGSNTPADTQKMAEEMKGLFTQIINNGNMTYAGRYVFSGYQTDRPFLKEDGTFNVDVSQFTIDNPPITRYEIGIGASIDISSNGLSLYGYETINNLFTSSIPIGNVKGSAATQSSFVGAFPLNVDYTGDNLNITVDDGVNPPATFDVDESQLDGTFFDIKKEKVLDAYRNALDGGGNKLSDVADIYYDTTDKLVIKMKAYGANTMTTPSALFTPTITAGVNTVEAAITTATTIDDAAVAAAPADFVNSEMVITYNGERKKIKLFDVAPAPATVADVVAEINAKLGAAFGPGKLLATGVSGGTIGIATDNSPENGIAPTLMVETIRAKESTLVENMRDFLTALNAGDSAGIRQFITQADFHMDKIVSVQADIGARVNRLELVVNRIAENNITYTRQLSDAQDADVGQVIMQLKNSENVYKSALAIGARVIQPTLLDFLR